MGGSNVGTSEGHEAAGGLDLVRGEGARPEFRQL